MELLKRILLVEDFKPYRSLIITLLSKDPNLRVISDVDNGLDAVGQAERLSPDVILLDVGLPRLNGLKAARRILKLAPSAKIIFLTQEADIEVVKEAFGLGAWGYVHKTNAETDLLVAINTVLRGERFVSSGSPNGEPATTSYA